MPVDHRRLTPRPSEVSGPGRVLSFSSAASRRRHSSASPSRSSSRRSSRSARRSNSAKNWGSLSSSDPRALRPAAWPCRRCVVGSGCRMS